MMPGYRLGVISKQLPTLLPKKSSMRLNDALMKWSEPNAHVIVHSSRSDESSYETTEYTDKG
jgi:hypothetical protein